MMRVGVFLRAVNLPGGRLLMADFKRALAQAGFEDAETVAATGNAVISAKSSDAKLEAAIAGALDGMLGGASEVFCRSGAELADVVRANPFAAFAKADPSHMVVVLLRGDPEAGAVAALQGKIKGPEEVAAGRRCLYATYPDDIGHSKLTAAMIERALHDRGTARNWNTLRRMTELTV